MSVCALACRVVILPLRKDVCECEMIHCATRASRVANALETNLKITLIKDIGRSCLMLSAPGHLGISEIIPKFKGDIFNIPNAKPLRMSSTRPLTIGQNALKKATGNPCGPGPYLFLCASAPHRVLAVEKRREV